MTETTKEESNKPESKKPEVQDKPRRKQQGKKSAKPVASAKPDNLLERLDVTRLKEYSDDLIMRHANRYKWALDRILEHLGRPANAILDFGCATGFGTRILLSASKITVGVDSSFDALRKAARYCRSGFVRFQLGSEANFSNPTLEIGRKYEAIVAIEVLEHLKAPAVFLQRARQFTNKSNGLLLLTTPEREMEAGNTPKNPYHVAEYRLEELRDIVDRSGWEVTKIDRTTMPGFLMLEAKVKA